MSAIRSFKDLEVWQLSIESIERCYQLPTRFPRDEMHGMTSQIRRSSVSVAANIAEGHGRESRQSFIQFLRQAQGSLKELETHLIIVERVKLAKLKIWRLCFRLRQDRQDDAWFDSLIAKQDRCP